MNLLKLSVLKSFLTALRASAVDVIKQDKILIKVFRQEKSYEAKNYFKGIPNRNWCL